jgi:hypothetical protein
MEQDTAAQIEKRLAELPEDVRNAVLSVEWEEKVRAIANKNALHIDQSGALGDTTLMAMLGFFSMADLSSHIAEGLNIPADKASAIATEVTNEVFMPIRDSLRKFTESAKAPEPAAPVAAAPVSAPIPPPKPKPDLSAAESMLETKTVSTPVVPPVVTPATPVAPPTAPLVKEEPPKPTNYSADPYREAPV